VNESIIRQLYIVRSITEDLLEKTPKEILDIIPDGFNNNIRWNFGHITFIQEKLVFGLSYEELSLPNSYQKYFSAGTKPNNSLTGVPSITEIAVELANQKERVREYLLENTHKTLPVPYTNKMGVTFYTFLDALLFSFYHEAIHVQTIKDIKKVIVNYK
jgi:hypothetical protein